MADPNTSIAKREEFRKNLEDQMTRYATSFLVELVGPDKAKKAAARLGLAMRQVAMANAAQTEAGKLSIYDASPAAIANAIAMCALTDLMPGGQHADCWVFPKGGSAGGLQWMMSHRGVIKLARRAGWEVRAVVVNTNKEDQDPEFADDWSFERNPFPTLHHVPRQPEPSWETVTACYVYYWPIGKREEVDVYVLTRSEIVARRARAQGRAQTWQDWPLEMVQKSAIKAAAARGLFPLDYESSLALKADDDAERGETIDVTPSERPAPAPERIATPPRSAVQRLADTLGDDDEGDDQGRGEPVPAAAVAAPEDEKPKRTRGPNKPKPDATPPVDENAANEANELLIRLTESERRQADGGVAMRQKHGIGVAVSRQQLVQTMDRASLMAFIRELES